MVVAGDRDAPEVQGDPAFPVNRGRLCIKGWTAAATLAHPERLTSPLLREATGRLVPASWDEALDRVTSHIRAIAARAGADGVAVFGSGALTNEKAYLLGKFARVALRTSRIDYNGRFCMSSAAAAQLEAFGMDRGLPFPAADLADADVVLLAGANVAETMPPLLQHLEAQRARGGALVVIDPRQTATARAATIHLAPALGTDAVVAHGLLHILIRDALVDAAYIERRTEGFGRVRATVAAYWPALVERLTGVAAADLERVAALLGAGRRVIVLTGRGVEQQRQGVANVRAFINLALALGQVGRPGGGFGTLTGQGNGQGGREHGQKADQLPGYRRIDDPAARRHLAAVWGVPEDEIPGPGPSACELLATVGTAEGPRGLLVFGANLAVSAPRALDVEARLRALDLLVVTDFFLSETAALAHVVLPAAQWAEEEGTMTNLEGRVLHRRPAFPPPPGVKSDLEILQALAARLGAGRHFAFAGPEEVFAELGRASAGGSADYSGITYEAIDREDGVFWPRPAGAGKGEGAGEGATEDSRRLFTERFPTPSGRARFSAIRHAEIAEPPDDEYPLYLTTGRLLEHYQSGTQTRRVPRLDALAPAPVAWFHPETAARHGLADRGEVTLASRRGMASFVVRITRDIREDTIFVPFHWGGAGSANRLTHAALDPISKMPELKACAVRVVPAAEGER